MSTEIILNRELLPKATLTYREMTILKYLLLGQNRAEIAENLMFLKKEIPAQTLAC